MSIRAATGDGAEEARGDTRNESEATIIDGNPSASGVPKRSQDRKKIQQLNKELREANDDNDELRGEIEGGR